MKTRASVNEANLTDDLFEFSPTPNYEKNQIYFQIQGACVLRATQETTSKWKEAHRRTEAKILETSRDDHVLVGKTRKL